MKIGIVDLPEKEYRAAPVWTDKEVAYFLHAVHTQYVLGNETQDHWSFFAVLSLSYDILYFAYILYSHLRNSW